MTQTPAGRNVAQATLDAVNLERAVRMRVRGASWSVIAAKCEYPSPAAALRAVGDAMRLATQRAETAADQMRDEAVMQLDALMAEAWGMLDERSEATYDEDGNQTASDDRAVRLRAVDEIRRLVESKAKLNRLHEKQEASEDAGGIRIIGVAVSDIA